MLQGRYHHPDNKVHGAHMGPTWGPQAPGGPHEPFLYGQSRQVKIYTFITVNIGKTWTLQSLYEYQCLYG